ncbi:hypothetical protein WJX84_002560 [Apatococcus fuscideae]|uniref:Uncharacterized protein n=1 Tax=Apatococcus fuscideae TaxID=2026836 RepID=A0AAW1TEM4_9CHLO
MPPTGSLHTLPSRAFSPSAQRVAVVNPYMFSYPTVAAIVHAVKVSGIQPEVFQQDNDTRGSHDRFTPHIRDLYRFICREHIQSIRAFMPGRYNIIILSDWYPTGCQWTPNDVTCSHLIMQLFKLGSLQHLIIHMHEPYNTVGSLYQSQWDTDVEMVARIKDDALRVLRDERTTLLTAAPHVADYTKASLALLDIHKEVGWFLQLFPWNTQVVRKERHGFIVQGKIDPERRDYRPLLEGIMQHPGLLEHPDFSLRLVGASTGASVDIARSDKIWTVIDRSSFKEYYQELQTCAGIVPAFGHTRYLHSAASSTLFTSVLLGIPVIADDEMLEKYSYLTKEAVLYQGPHETVFDVMARTLRSEFQLDEASVFWKDLIRNG